MSVHVFEIPNGWWASKCDIHQPANNLDHVSQDYAVIIVGIVHRNCDSGANGASCSSHRSVLVLCYWTLLRNLLGLIWIDWTVSAQRIFMSSIPPLTANPGHGILIICYWMDLLVMCNPHQIGKTCHRLGLAIQPPSSWPKNDGVCPRLSSTLLVKIII